MQPEERQVRIGDGVDQPAHGAARLDGQLEVLAAERHDHDTGLRPGQARDPVAVQAGAVDREARRDRAGGRLEDDFAAAIQKTHHPRPRPDLPSGARDQAGQGGGDGAVVGDRGARHVQRGDAAAERLDVAHLLRPQKRQATHAVRDAATVDLLQTGNLARLGRHHELAAAQERHAVLLAEAGHGRRPFGAQAGLVRARPVKDAGVDDTAVAAALVRAHAVLLLEDDDSHLRVESDRGQGGREPDDPPSDDDERAAHGTGSNPLDLGLWIGDQKGDSSTGLPSLPLGGGGGTYPVGGPVARISLRFTVT